MFSKFGTMEIILILAVVLLIFGPKNLPKLGKAIGQTLSGFKKGHKDGFDDEEAPRAESASAKSSSDENTTL